MAVELFLHAGQPKAEGLQHGVAVNPMGIESDGRCGAGEGGGEDQASPRSQNPDHLGKGFPVGGGVKLIPVPPQPEMLQGAKGNNQVKRVIGQGKPFGVAGNDGFVLHGRPSGTDIDGGEGGMGEQSQDEVPVRTHVQDLLGLGPPDMKGGKGALMIDKILGMLPAFKEGFLKHLEPARVSFQGFPLSVIKFLRIQPKLLKEFTAEHAEYAEIKQAKNGIME